jgi:hypothetical protein
MKRGWRIVLNVTILLAFFASVTVVLIVRDVTRYAMVKQGELPSSTFYQTMLQELEAEFTWHMQTIEPDDSNDPALKRFPLSWSTAKPWTNPDAPADLIEAVNDNLNRLVEHIRTEGQDFYLNRPVLNPLLRDETGRGKWVLAMRLYVVDDDTVAIGALTPSDAMYDHYLPRWFETYLHHSPGTRLAMVAERFPLQLLAKPTHSSRDTLYLLDGTEQLIMFDQVFPREDIEKYEIEVNELVPGIGWLAIRGPGIMDEMVLGVAKKVNVFVYVMWVILFIGLVWLMVRSERARNGI